MKVAIETKKEKPKAEMKLEPLLNHALFGQKLTVDQFPKKTKICCWYDTCPFSTGIYVVCDHINEDLKIYNVSGVFCSHECYSCFLSDQASYRTPQLLMYSHRANKLLHPLEKMNKKEPKSRFQLDKFGGTLTIEQFRS